MNPGANMESQTWSLYHEEQKNKGITSPRHCFLRIVCYECDDVF